MKLIPATLALVLAALFAQGVEAGICTLRYGIKRGQCNSMIAAGCPVRWYGRGANGNDCPKRSGDGGCQPKDYCGFKCAAKCQKVRGCMWKGGRCQRRSTCLPNGATGCLFDYEKWNTDGPGSGDSIKRLLAVESAVAGTEQVKAAVDRLRSRGAMKGVASERVLGAEINNE